jgi:hypothetical protein
VARSAAGGGDGRSGRTLKYTGNVVLIMIGLALVAGGVNNQAISAVANTFGVQLAAPGAVAVRILFVVLGFLILLRGLDGLWGAEVRALAHRAGSGWHSWRAAHPPDPVAGVPPGVPPDHNPPFRDREVGLAQPHAQLAAERRVDLTGLGGVGKSQLARDLLYRRSDDCADGVFRLRGESLATLTGDLAALAWLPEFQLEVRTQRDQRAAAIARARSGRHGRPSLRF